MPSSEPTPCSKCGSTNRTYGTLKGLSEVKFYTGVTLMDAVIGGDTVIALACLKCGDIELVLEKVPREYAERMEGKA
jgi:hypothetical protein